MSRVRDGEDAYEDVDLEGGKSPANSDRMAEFIREVEAVKGEINKVKQLLMKLKSANEESKVLANLDAVKAIRARMDDDIASVTKSARFIKAKLEELDNANLTHRNVPGCGAGSAADRQRVSLTENQRKKLKELMDEFHALRTKMMNDHKDTITRRYFTLTGKQADEERVESMIRTGKSETFLQVAIREQGRGPVLETIREIQERHDGIKEIETHLLELHSIFIDMSVIVNAQGDKINDLEADMKRSVSYTRQGAEYLVDAKRYRVSSRKRKLSCCSILLLIIIIIVIVVYVVLSNKK